MTVHVEVQRVVFSGADLRWLMRRCGVTVPMLSQRMGITQKRIREIRQCGLCVRAVARDWIQGVTGVDPGADPDFSKALFCSRQPRSKRDEVVANIARETLHLPTLETRRADSLDFHDMAVWEIKKALEIAYEAGVLAGGVR